MPRPPKTFRISAPPPKEVPPKPPDASLLGQHIPSLEPTIPSWPIEIILARLLSQLKRRKHKLLAQIIIEVATLRARNYVDINLRLIRAEKYDLLPDEHERDMLFAMIPAMCARQLSRLNRNAAKHSSTTIQLQANSVTKALKQHFSSKPKGNLVSWLRTNLPKLLSDLQQLHHCGEKCGNTYSTPPDQRLNQLARFRTLGQLRNAILGYCHTLSIKTIRSRYFAE